MSSSQQNHNVEVQVVVLDSYDQRTLRLYGFLESQQSPPAFSSANLREKLTEILEPTAGVKILDVKIIPLPDNS